MAQVCGKVCELLQIYFLSSKDTAAKIFQQLIPIEIHRN